MPFTAEWTLSEFGRRPLQDDADGALEWLGSEATPEPSAVLVCRVVAVLDAMLVAEPEGSKDRTGDGDIWFGID